MSTEIKINSKSYFQVFFRATVWFYLYVNVCRLSEKNCKWEKDQTGHSYGSWSGVEKGSGCLKKD